MPANLRLFGLVHLLILCAVPSLAALLAVAHRRLLIHPLVLRSTVACLLLLCSSSYYASFALHGDRMFPNHVPLELCDASLWLVILSLVTLRPAFFDLAYYFALAGASMSLLTPNMVAPSLFLSVQFFADHGLLVISILYLLWSGQARPRPWSVFRAMVGLNVFAVIAGAFDAIFKTDYMFLRSKPPTVSALDLLGPWPWYILSCEGVAMGLFLLLYLPFRTSESPATA